MSLQIGMLGYPLTPLYGMAFIALAMYVYYWMLRHLSRPMERRWMQSTRSIFYLSVLGLMLIVVIAFILGICLMSVICVNKSLNNTSSSDSILGH